MPVFKRPIAKNPSSPDHPPKASHTPSTIYKRTLSVQRSSQSIIATVDARKGLKNAPSISSTLPIVLFHCRPARAICCSSWSAPSDFLCAWIKVEFKFEFKDVASRVEDVGPEKYA